MTQILDDPNYDDPKKYDPKHQTSMTQRALTPVDAETRMVPQGHNEAMHAHTLPSSPVLSSFVVAGSLIRARLLQAIGSCTRVRRDSQKGICSWIRLKTQGDHGRCHWMASMASFTL
eukprot:1401590-Amphidinium_carterae.1